MDISELSHKLVMRAVDNESNAYQEYLDQIEANKKFAIENECNQGRHNWAHYYNGYVRCSTCGQELP